MFSRHSVLMEDILVQIVFKRCEIQESIDPTNNPYFKFVSKYSHTTTVQQIKEVKVLIDTAEPWKRLEQSNWNREYFHSWLDCKTQETVLQTEVLVRQGRRTKAMPKPLQDTCGHGYHKLYLASSISWSSWLDVQS
jgi:hypothetical protein